jgi:hypothetical protein
VKRSLTLTAALVAAVAVFVLLTGPPARLVLPEAWSDGTIRGVVHVHTTRSDGRGTADEVAAAAARAGVRFLIFADHGDGTRRPDPPRYRSGVLCLDGVEVSTIGGHYLAIGMEPAPYPLGGEPRDVIEDVRRLHGFGVAAHPDSPKPELRWREWTAPFDAIETLNPDSSWREWIQAKGWRPKFRLIEGLGGYTIRPSEAIANLIVPTKVLYEWSLLVEHRRVVMIAGTDAHSKIALVGGDPTPYSLPFPGYEAAFKALSIHIAADRPFSGNAVDDAAIVVRALRAGHLYSVIDGVASPPAFELTAANAHGTAREGDELAVGGPLTIHVRSNAPSEFVRMIFDGANLVSGDHHEQDFSYRVPALPGAYRVEIRSTQPGQAAWLMSNPIYVRGPAEPSDEAARPAPTGFDRLFNGTTIEGWHLEHAPTSSGAVDMEGSPSGGELRLQYSLGSRLPVGQYVAAVCDTPNGTGASDRIGFRVRAEHPMRISVQLRAMTGNAAGDRWQRSVYVDEVERDRVVYFDDLTPAGPTRTWRPPFARVRSILFVVDTTNTKPGSSGHVWIRAPALGR